MLEWARYAIENWRQTLSVCILWGAVAGSASLCLFAPTVNQAQERALGPGLGGIMLSLASKAF
jgi:hypothetical protein